MIIIMIEDVKDLRIWLSEAHLKFGAVVVMILVVDVALERLKVVENCELEPVEK